MAAQDVTPANMTSSSTHLPEVFSTDNMTSLVPTTKGPQNDDVTKQLWFQVIFIIIYCIIFLVGVSGNFLVMFVVLRNKAMQTITNIFITNLAASDIMICILAVPFTPIAALMDTWIFGEALCKAVPMIMSVNVFVSTLTSIAIAVDRYFVIVHPFKQRIKVWLCIVIIFAIWLIAVCTSLPIAVFMKHTFRTGNTYECSEDWPGQGETSQFFTVMMMALQYIVPCIVIMFCYTAVSLALRKRSLMKIGSKSREREEMEIKRKRRTNRMLISMIAIFVGCWLPLNVFHLVTSFMLTEDIENSRYITMCFVIAHVIAMSSTVYNPFLYAFMNDNFRNQFNQIVPCLFRGLEFRGKKNGTAAGSTYTAIETQNSFLNRSPSRENVANQPNANSGSTTSVKGSAASYEADAERVHLHVAENGEC